jgi:hypothetical protein
VLSKKGFCSVVGITSFEKSISGQTIASFIEEILRNKFLTNFWDNFWDNFESLWAKREI